MESITLKELSAYLPYRVKIEHSTMVAGKRKISELRNLGKTNIEISHRLYVQISNCKPLLRPLSDLKKEIEINGERFVPIDYFVGYDVDLILNAVKFKDLSYISYNLVQKLLEWHFDCFNLIERGLAIDLNSI